MKVTAKLKTATAAGAVLGVAALGAAAGAVAQRYAFHRLRRNRDDPYIDEPFGELPYDETQTVFTEDGVPLYVETIHPPDKGKPELTVIFVHGFCLHMGMWHFQRKALSQLRSPRCRLVCYDQPGHGRSGTRASGEYTLDQLAADAYAVIQAVAPDGPLVLMGHSMGGMTVMALAERYPSLFAKRVVGVGLFSTSAGHLDDVALGMPSVFTRVRRPLMPTISGALRSHPAWVERGRMSGSDLTYLLAKRYGFASPRASQTLVEYAEHMNSSTAIQVIAGYLGTLFEHDRYAALKIIGKIKTLVVCGDKDLVTPVEHTREIAKLMPRAELVEIVNGGHLTLMEHSEIVNAHIIDFLCQVNRELSKPRLRKNRR